MAHPLQLPAAALVVLCHGLALGTEAAAAAAAAAQPLASQGASSSSHYPVQDQEHGRGSTEALAVGNAGVHGSGEAGGAGGGVSPEEVAQLQAALHASMAELEALQVHKGQLEAALLAEQRRVNEWYSRQGAPAAPSAALTPTPSPVKAAQPQAPSGDKKHDGPVPSVESGGAAFEETGWDPENAALQGGSSTFQRLAKQESGTPEQQQLLAWANSIRSSNPKARVEAPLPLASYSYLQHFVYCFYPPLYIAGPTITFNDFASQIAAPPRQSAREVSACKTPAKDATLIEEVHAGRKYIYMT
uniref:Uncharacterized protein n=1 Tax=Dunaliella tertiolecta TaxID=3047 RepID=A0A7S3VI79_DUNTE